MPLSPQSYAPNPHLPFVSFKTVDGGTDYANPSDNRPQHLVDFSVTILADGVGNWSLTLFDPKWDVIETDIITNFKKGVEIRWGYQGGIQSGKHTGWILDYTPNWEVNGVTLKINGCFEDQTKGVAPKISRTFPDVDNYSDDKAKMKISEIVESIAKKNGWSTDIEETLDTVAIAGLGTEIVSQPFTQNNMGDMAFIRECLAPHAISKKDKAGNYMCFFEPANKTLHFKPTNYDQDPIETFNYLQDKMTEIVSLVPRFPSGLFGTLSTKVQAWSVDAHSKDISVATSERGVQAARHDGDKTAGVLSDVDDAAKKASVSTVNSHAVTANSDNGQNVSKAIWNSLYDYGYFTADMVIVGNHKYLPLQIVAITVKAPTNNNKHLLDGNYLILGVTHMVTSASYMTQLHIAKNSGKLGELEAAQQAQAAETVLESGVLISL